MLFLIFSLCDYMLCLFWDIIKVKACCSYLSVDTELKQAAAFNGIHLKFTFDQICMWFAVSTEVRSGNYLMIYSLTWLL